MLIYLNEQSVHLIIRINVPGTLGFTYFVMRLTWKIHVHKELKPTISSLGENPTHFLHDPPLLYKTIILPILTYACPVSYRTSSTNVRRMFPNKVLRKSVNAPWFARNWQL